MYRPLNLKSSPLTGYVTTTLPRKGINTADTPQLLSMDYALVLDNYIPKRYGIEKRGGLNAIFDKAVDEPISMLIEYTDNIWIFAYGNKVEAYNINTGVFTLIKEDFAGNKFEGERYGDYMFITNGVDRLCRISRTVKYTNMTTAFKVGETLTGSISGATSVILENDNTGTEGTLTLGRVKGEYMENESIQDKEGGTADIDGNTTFSIATIYNAPVCGGLKVIGARLHLFRLNKDESATQYSPVDSGANPPFNTWTQTTASDDGGMVNYRNAGSIRSVNQLGYITVVFSDKGFFAYYLNQIDSGGIIKKTEIIQNYTVDYGGARGAITTPHGIFYINEAGLWQMVAVGETEEPMSRQQLLKSRLIKSEYFKDIDQGSVDMVYDTNQNLILITCAKSSTSNNLVIGYSLDTEGFFTISNWNISRFAKSDQMIYGASSVGSKIYKLFEGYSDDGMNINTKCVFEVPMKGLYYLNDLVGIYAGGLLSPSTKINISTDIYDWQGNKKVDKTNDVWSANISADSSMFEEWGNVEFGRGSFGGAYASTDTEGLVESFGGSSTTARNFQRLRIKLTNSDELKHILTWLSARTTTKQPIRRRNIKKL